MMLKKLPYNLFEPKISAFFISQITKHSGPVISRTPVGKKNLRVTIQFGIVFSSPNRARISARPSKNYSKETIYWRGGRFIAKFLICILFLFDQEWYEFLCEIEILTEVAWFKRFLMSFLKYVMNFDQQIWIWHQIKRHFCTLHRNVAFFYFLDFGKSFLLTKNCPAGSF